MNTVETLVPQHMRPVLTTTFRNARLILPDGVVRGDLTTRDGRITSMGPTPAGSDSTTVTPPAESNGSTVIDAAGRYLAPGFIDMHVHGGAGADFMDFTAEAFDTALRCHVRHGVTALAPTNTVAKRDRIVRFFELVRSCKRSPVAGCPRVLGAHLYGPFFNPDKIGCHPHDARPPTEAEYREFFEFADCLLVATCAPELPGAIEFYRAAATLGVKLTAGHSNSTWTEMQTAYEAGVRHVDHFFCAMSNYVSTRSRVGTPMQGGMLEFVLNSDDMTTELIADGRHLGPELLRFPLKMMGVDRVALVSDCSRALDVPPGDYIFGPIDGGEPFYSDGSVGLTLDRKGLASSVRGLDFMVRQTIAAGVPLDTAVRMASLTPAKILGVEKDLGSIAVGKAADLVLLNEQLEVERVWIGGVEQPVRKVVSA